MKKFYIETFGCQMNAHDSEKVIGTLLSQRLRAGGDARRSRAGSLQHLQHPRQGRAEGLPPAAEVQARAGKGKIFGVLGCVAQQEGEKIFDRAPHVSLVAGSASYTELPRNAGAARSRQPARHRPEPRYRRDVRHAVHPPRQSAPRLHHDHRRLRQILRLLRGAVHARAGAQPHQRKRHARKRAAWRTRATPKSSCSARTSTAIAIRRPPAGISPRCCERVGAGPRHPPRAVHHFASARFREGDHRRDRRQPGAVRSRAPAGAVGLHARARAHAAALHPRRVHAPHRVDEERAARDIAITTDIIVGFPGETEEDFQADARPARRSAVRFAVQLQVFAASEHRRARAWRTTSRKRRNSAAC